MSADDSNTNVHTTGGCSCGKVRYTLKGATLFRAYCHCQTCQAYNQAERADILVMRSGDVVLDGEHHIDFRFHQKPPVIKRGTCASCGGVAIEKIHLPLSPKLTIIPAQTLDAPERAPRADFHMFYHRSIKEAEDRLPTHSGYLKSQWAFTAAVIKGLRGHRSAA